MLGAVAAGNPLEPPITVEAQATRVLRVPLGGSWSGL